MFLGQALASSLFQFRYLFVKPAAKTDLCRKGSGHRILTGNLDFSLFCLKDVIAGHTPAEQVMNRNPFPNHCGLQKLFSL